MEIGSPEKSNYEKVEVPENGGYKMVLLSTIGRRKKIRQDMSFKRAFFL
jgi:hypothetical protein